MTEFDTRGSRMQMPRSRGAASGMFLVVLGAWGALVPFIGPYFDFAFTPNQSWVWTTGRGWLEVLPGAVAVLGGLLLLTSGNRATAMLGGWLAVVAGAWFVIGRSLTGVLAIGDAGAPVAVTDAKRIVLELAYFSALGAAIVFVGAVALGRLSVRTLRDVAYAQRPVMAETRRRAVAEPAPVAAAAAPAAEVPASDASAAPKRHGWGGMFGRRHTHAH
jgi:hypothetical protein